MIKTNLNLDEHLALCGVVPRSYFLGLIPLFLYLIYKVSSLTSSCSHPNLFR